MVVLLKYYLYRCSSGKHFEFGWNGRVATTGYVTHAQLTILGFQTRREGIATKHNFDCVVVREYS